MKCQLRGLNDSGGQDTDTQWKENSEYHPTRESKRIVMANQQMDEKTDDMPCASEQGEESEDEGIAIDLISIYLDHIDQRTKPTAPSISLLDDAADIVIVSGTEDDDDYDEDGKDFHNCRRHEVETILEEEDDDEELLTEAIIDAVKSDTLQIAARKDVSKASEFPIDFTTKQQEEIVDHLDLGISTTTEVWGETIDSKIEISNVIIEVENKKIGCKELEDSNTMVFAKKAEESFVSSRITGGGRTNEVRMISGPCPCSSEDISEEVKSIDGENNETVSIGDSGAGKVLLEIVYYCDHNNLTVTIKDIEEIPSVLEGGAKRIKIHTALLTSRCAKKKDKKMKQYNNNNNNNNNNNTLMKDDYVSNKSEESNTTAAKANIGENSRYKKATTCDSIISKKKNRNKNSSPNNNSMKNAVTTATHKTTMRLATKGIHNELVFQREGFSIDDFESMWIRVRLYGKYGIRKRLMGEVVFPGKDLIPDVEDGKHQQNDSCRQTFMVRKPLEPKGKVVKYFYNLISVKR